MVEWKTYRMGDICKNVCSGGTPKSTNPLYYDGDIPWLNTKEIDFNRISSTQRCITQEGLDNSSAKWIDACCVIVAMYGATAGKVAINTIPLTTNQACCNLSIDENIADYKYVYYYLCAHYFELASLANGGAQQNLNAQQIKAFEISLPPLPEQKRIAGILSALDDKIELNRRINANLEAQAMALYKHWFVDFEFPNSAEKPYKSSGGKMIDSDFGPIPAGWHIGKVNDLGIIICGKTPSKAIAANYGDAIPFIKIPDMHNHVFVHKSDEMLSIVGSDSQIKKLLPPYSVLVSCIATVGLVSMNVVPSHTNQQINSVIPNDVIYRYYLYLMFKNMALDLQNYGRGGTATLNVNTSTFANIKVLLPSRQILEWFYLRIQSMFELIRYNQEEIYNLSSIRNALLHKLIREEIKM